MACSTSDWSRLKTEAMLDSSMLKEHLSSNMSIQRITFHTLRLTSRHVTDTTPYRTMRLDAHVHEKDDIIYLTRTLTAAYSQHSFNAICY